MSDRGRPSIVSQKALFDLARGTCYFPGCATRTVVFVEEGLPVVNVDVAHIHGDRPGSARFDPAMTDEARRAFVNLLLLCTPHHRLVDQLDPDRFPADLLRRWKAEREELANVGALSELDLSSADIQRSLEDAVRAAVLQRELEVEVSAGVQIAATDLVSMPVEALREMLERNAHLRGPIWIVTTVHNIGWPTVGVEAFGLQFRVTRPDGPPVVARLIGRNDAPWLNQKLPASIATGQSCRWLTSIETIELHRSLLHSQGQDVMDLRGEVSFGPDGLATSEWASVTHLHDLPTHPG